MGPYYYELADRQETISGEDYLSLVRNKIVPRLESKLSASGFKRVTFQQNGHRYQEGRATMCYLESVFGDKIISKNGPLHWPSYYKDLHPVNYWFETALMRSLYEVELIPSTINDIKTLVHRFSSLIGNQIFMLAVMDFSMRGNTILQCYGDQFEQIIERYKFEWFKMRLGAF